MDFLIPYVDPLLVPSVHLVPEVAGVELTSVRPVVVVGAGREVADHFTAITIV
ncbi:hypothetical protein DPMN_172931 [Dreissena polymorpha]|uniref:Uncharacterized protein n=1 Tax=Dreissena polymorpha TaxID=45954 RepID=A0A9D4IF21_DREPO|nr:hypothetical protein DPMN_172931 [Dreissena polymorpha]